MCNIVRQCIGNPAAVCSYVMVHLVAIYGRNVQRVMNGMGAGVYVWLAGSREHAETNRLHCSCIHVVQVNQASV